MKELIYMKEEYVRQLVDRFLEGETSNEQEQQLYAYFRQKGIPESLQPYREMFQWYDDGMQSPTIQELEQQVTQTSKQVRVVKFRKLWIAVSVAAMLVLVGGAGIYFMRQQQIREQYSEYAGSYIIRNGKKMTDLALIMPELKQVERQAEEKEEKINQLLSQSSEAAIRQQLLEKASSDEERKMINELLDE